MSFMGPGFLIYFQPGERVLSDPLQIPLSLVNYHKNALSVANSISIPLGVTQKSEHSMQIIK